MHRSISNLAGMRTKPTYKKRRLCPNLNSTSMDPPPTHRPVTRIMDIHAGIALGGVTEDTPFACTCFDLAEPPRIHKPSISSPPTEHALSISTPEDTVGYIPGETNLEHMKRHKTFALSYPIVTSEEQQRATSKVVNGYNGYCSNHCEAFLAGCQFGISESRGVVEALFIDLTPSRVTAVVMQGVINKSKWTSEKVRETAVLGKVDKLSIENFDELISLVAPNLSILECVAVLRPEGAFPEPLPIKIELKFVNIPFKWLSLSDLTHGSAMMLWRIMAPQYTRCGRIVKRTQNVHYVHLADGTLLDITQHDRHTSIKGRYIFTTSKDNQITATLQLGTKINQYGDCVEYEGIVIRGLEPRPKGNLRIKVMIEPDTVNIGGGKVAIIRDLDSNLDVRLSLREKTRDGIEEISDASVGTPVQYARPIYGIDGVIGELPE
jgi:hypothetical protein